MDFGVPFMADRHPEYDLLGKWAHEKNIKCSYKRKVPIVKFWEKPQLLFFTHRTMPSSRLLALPAEILNKIVEEVLTSPTPLTLRDFAQTLSDKV